MRKLYLEPVSETFEVRLEGGLCLSGGKAGEEGKPGAEFDPSEDIYDYDDL